MTKSQSGNAHPRNRAGGESGLNSTPGGGVLNRGGRPSEPCQSRGNRRSSPGRELDRDSRNCPGRAPCPLDDGPRGFRRPRSMDTSHNLRPVRRRSAMRRTLRWLGLATVVLVCRRSRPRVPALVLIATARRRPPGPIPTATASPTTPRSAGTTPIRARRDTDRDGLSDGDEVRRYHTNPRKAGHRSRRPERRREVRPLPHRSAQGATPTATASPTATRSAATTPTHSNGTPTATGTATEPRSAGHEPRSPPQSSRFPARGHHRCAGRDAR